MTEYYNKYKDLLDDFEGFIERDEAIPVYGFAIPTKEVLTKIAQLGPILEVGAGTGYWSYELQKLGADVIATDKSPHQDNRYGFNKTWVDIEIISAQNAIKKYPERVLLMVWPCYNKPWAWETLKAYKGDTVVYVGEFGGCTADNKFHDLIDDEWDMVRHDIPRWEGLRDAVWILTRKGKK